MVEQDRDRALLIVDSLREAGDYDIHVIGEQTGLARRISERDPDIVLIDIANPSRDTLEELTLASSPLDRPVAMFVDRSEAGLTKAAIEAGVSAYVVDGLKPARLKPVLDAATARFRMFQRMRTELAETKKAAQSVIDAFRGLKANFLVQDFVKEAAGEDIRCLVVGGKVVAAMKRTGAEGDFRSNLHRGGTAQVVRITKVERDTALRAARAFGLGTAGVDLLRSDSGPKVLEVNSSPGFEGIEKATGKDIVGMVYDMIEARVKPQPVRKRKA